MSRLYDNDIRTCKDSILFLKNLQEFFFSDDKIPVASTARASFSCFALGSRKGRLN